MFFLQPKADATNIEKKKAGAATAAPSLNI